MRFGRLSILASLAALGLLLMSGPLACRYPISESMVFQGRKSPELSDQVIRQNVSIPLPEGGALRGAWFRTAGAKAVLVHFYGNAEGLNRMSMRATLLAQRFNLDVLCVDLRGYGASDGTPNLARVREDALRVYDLADGARLGRPVIVYGYSLGSVSASHVAANRPVAGLVLAAPIATFAELLPAQKRLLPWYLRMVAPFFRVDPAPGYLASPQPVEDIAKSRVPLIVLHGEVDRIIPIASGRRVHAASPAPSKRFVPFPGLDHQDLDLAFSGGAAREAFEDLLKQVLGK